MPLSGAQWVALYPTSTSVSDLELDFRTSLNNFLAALNASGASYTIAATLRPPERAYLMHWSYRIARESYDPRQVPAMAGVNIDWVHKRPNGSYDETASRSAANAMTTSYGTVYRPSLTCRHTEGRAVDMNINWSGTLRIRNAQGQEVSITSTPRSGANTNLHEVGASYGVVKLVSDPPHWSDDGH